jgi:hypothetical protein
VPTRPFPGCVTRRRRALFHTTNPEDRAIAAAAINGFNNPNAASGMAARL